MNNEACIFQEEAQLPCAILVDHCQISSAAADNAEKQYNSLIKNADFLTETKKFRIIDDDQMKFMLVFFIAVILLTLRTLSDWF